MRKGITMRKPFTFLVLSGLLAIFANAQQSIDKEAAKAPTEIVSLRTEHSETFDNHDGTHTTRIYSGKKYYRDGGEYKKIDLSVKMETKDGFTRAVNTGFYTYRYDPADKNKGYSFIRGEYYIRYSPSGNWAGKSSAVTPVPEGIKEVVTFTAGADPTVSWTVSTNAEVSFADGVLTCRDSTGAFLFMVPRAMAFDSTGLNIPVKASFTGDTLSYALSLPKNITWPVILDPSTTITASQDGGTYNSGSVSYANSRDASAATSVSPNYWYVGQKGTYYVYRSFACFPIPELLTVTACSLYVNGAADFSDTDFDVYIHGASEYKSTLTVDDYPHFDGRQTGQPHNGTVLNETWNSSSYSSDWNVIVFNAAGRDSAEASAGDTLWIALISKEDYNNSPHTQTEEVVFESSTHETDKPYLSLTYATGPESPGNFTMTSLDTTTIACSWTDESNNEQKFYIINWADSSVVDSTAANAVADTISGLSANTRYVWAVVADSSGIKGYSAPDSSYTYLAAPDFSDISISPISSDTLCVSISPPVNSTSDSTGMEVYAVSGSGATGSGWLSGEYSYLDGGLNPDSMYVYKVRFRNGDGNSTAWSPDVSYQMNGLDTLTVYLSGDIYDDYNINFGSGYGDSTVVRVGASNSGERFDGFLSFEIPWYVHKGAVDSLFLRLTRTEEESLRTPTIKVYGIPVKDIEPVEGINVGSQDSTDAWAGWTVSSGEGQKTSPDLRHIFREWQNLSPFRDYYYGFGLRLDDNSQADSVRTVFLDYSHQSYSNGTSITIYYTPGYGDSLDAAPCDFSLSVEGPDSLFASWTDNSSYELGFVLLNVSDSTQVAGVDTLAENTTSTGVGDLTPNTVYQWFVRAFSAVDDSSSAGTNARTEARTPGVTSVEAISDSSLKFVINPLDNPAYTTFAVQDSITGLYVDASSEPDTLREGPPGDWGWRTFSQWGAALGDTISGLNPDSLYVIRAKARSGE